MSDTRRSFLKITGGTLLAAALGPALLPRRADYDLILRRGTLFDGLGAAGVERDIAILNGRIAAIAARITGSATEEIDARGLAVAPGFVDIHSHGDGSLDDDPRAESLVRQGITTIITGQDGGSRATGAADKSFTDLFAGLEHLSPSVNVAAMVGLGTVRGAVVGNADRPATSAELATMTRMVENALAQGACGASSGLEYTPGAFASREELIALCRPLAARGLVYATHMRNEDDRLLEAIEESIAVASGAGCGLQISHLKTQGPRNWPRLDQAFGLIEAAKTQRLDIAFDRYPYVAYSTGLTNLFPVWSRDGGSDAFLARLADSTVAPRIREETLAKVALIGGWDNVMVTSVGTDEDRPAEGKRLGSFAASRKEEPYELTVRLLSRNRGSVGMVGFAMSEENLERILAHPQGMVCSDGGSFATEGPARRGSPHPRGLGTYPRVLGKYVREQKALTLEDAIRKMSSAPASRARLRDRGILAKDAAADIVVFDPSTVSDQATFEQPFQYPVGIRIVIVNGRIALREGARVGTGNGKALRPNHRR
jgi:N-acyl-D-amino-acid deacylase